MCLIWRWLLILHCIRSLSLNSSCDHVLCASISCVYKRNSCHLHIWIPHAFLFICECLQFFFFNLLYKNRLPSLGWKKKKSWHKIIWCVYIWVSKYNSYHIHLSLSHLSFTLCTAVTIMTSRRKAGSLPPKCPWVFPCSLSSYKWSTFNSRSCRFNAMQFSVYR